MSKKDVLYQQGDVLMFKVNEIPKTCKNKKPQNNEWVLAEGEATGHKHTVTLDGCKLMEDDDKQLWLRTSKSVTIKHQEHKAITIPKGKYRIGIVQEIDPFTEEIKKARD